MRTRKKNKKKNENIINELESIYKDDITFVNQKISTQDNTFSIMYLKGNTDSSIIIDSITTPLSFNNNLSYVEKTEFTDIDTAVVELSKGQVLVVDHNENEVYLINCQQIHLRSISEPKNEQTINGSKEGFIESMISNIALIRQKLPHKDLRFKHMTLGEGVKTDISIAYLENICDENLLNDLEGKLKKIKIEGIFSAAYIDEAIKDNKYSLFNTLGETERPDALCAKLLEGGVGIIVNGSPSALLAPHFFVENFKSPDDYYTNFYYGSFTRLLRYLAFFITIMAPALYVSMIGFHHELIPSYLALNIVAASSFVPLGVIIETVLFIILFELLREAGVRMPSVVGQALSIVGAIIIGQAAVEAKIVSAPIIIVVSITAVTGFMTPKINTLVIFTRFFILLLAIFFGIYGIMVALIIFLAKLFSLDSYKTTYSTNFFGLSVNRIKDSIVRVPQEKFNKNEKVKRGG